MPSLDGQIALVTGAARGLGEAVMRTLCREGATVIGCDIRAEALARAVAEVDGRLDIRVDNAAVIDTNLRGAFLTCRRAVPQLKRQRSGTIVKAISTAALAAWPCASACHASKRGLRGFTNGLSQALRGDGVRVSGAPQLVADAIPFVLALPPTTHVPELVIMPMRDPSFP